MSENPTDGDDPKPNWDLIRRDPAKFFQLEKGFNRKDLKRSYNRLLRRFKPEKFPEEFQRIRSAYEELERRLRYGEVDQGAPQNAWSDNASDIVIEAVPGEQERSTTPSKQRKLPPLQTIKDPRALSTLAESLNEGKKTVDEVYAQIRKQPNKTPQEYYALALLSDVCEPDKPLLFVQWLLTGLNNSPHDQGLQSLVYHLLSSQIDDRHLSKVLIACSQAVSNDSFYAFTEVGWDRLMRLVPFKQFVELLTKCEANLNDRQGAISGRLTFYLHTLRYAFWVDHEGWSQKTFGYLEENYDQIPRHLEGDLDLLSVIQDYVPLREEFLSIAPIGKQLDAVLQKVFTEDPLQADRAMVACQMQILSEPSSVLQLFTEDEKQHGPKAFYMLWRWVSKETIYRLGLQDEEEIDYQFWRLRVNSWLSKTVASKPSKSAMWEEFLERMYVVAQFGVPIVIGGLACLTTMMLGMSIGSQVFGVDKDDIRISLLAVIVAIVAAILFYLKWRNTIREKYWIPHLRRRSRKNYVRFWQPECVEFLNRSMLDYFDFRGLLEQVPTIQTVADAIWINSYVQKDIGLAVYSVACEFQE